MSNYLLCPLPVLAKDFHGRLRLDACNEALHIRTSGGGMDLGPEGQPLSAWPTTWTLECDNGHVLLVPLSDDGPGPDARLEEALGYWVKAATAAVKLDITGADARGRTRLVPGHEGGPC